MAKLGIEHGDARDVLRTLGDSSVSACVTDPPYSLVAPRKFRSAADLQKNAIARKLDTQGASPFASQARGFMGKRWDNGETAFDPAFWAEVLRVLKPGGHLLAFGGTRTYHRLVCAIEDAGFEVRDTIGWLFGSGFPKSHDVSKAIDKMAGAVREVVGRKLTGTMAGQSGTLNAAHGWKGGQEVVDVTAPATEAARQWDGWGTALKPALELVCVARKPLSEGTVAANVLAHGTGAINVAACKVAAEERPLPTGRNGNVYGAGLEGSRQIGATTAGRWPANLCHDGSDEVVRAFPDSGNGSTGSTAGSGVSDIYGAFERRTRGEPIGFGDSGSAARFFYCAKADADDRLASKHPTVKPVDLMRWLVRLVCPPGGTVLDPFAGSGTTGMACMAEGFDCILIEREAEYVADIKARIAHVHGTDTPLFAAADD